MAIQTTYTSADELFEQILIIRKKKSIGTDIRKLRAAFRVASTEYGTMMHWTGETVLLHCLGVLNIYTEFDPDDDAVIATLLHHLLDSKRWTLADIEREYGENVRDMISGEFLLSHATMQNKRMSLENLRLMFLKVSGDLRLVLLILSQHAHLLDRLDSLDAETRKHSCRDTLHILAPVAARLGVYSLKHRLESRAFPIMYPTDAERIEEQLHQIHEKYGDFLPDAAEHLIQALQQAGITATAEVREKQPYSIFQKMQLKSHSHVDELYDLFALRIIVETEDECYQTLGVLHRIGHPVAGRFKDYIAFPKPNGYKSIHTTLARLPAVPEGVFIEAQIRTNTMQRAANLGIAAHWSYKEGGAAEQALHLAQVQLALTESPELRDRLQGSDQIFVLTPRGDVIELPEGSTPLDFAFHVHTILGLSFKAAKVNGSIVSMDYELENGDIIEIVKHADPRPSPRWITLLKTASARSRLKKFLVTREALDSSTEEEIVPAVKPTKKQVRPMPKEKGTTYVVKADSNIPMPVLYAKCCKPDNKTCPAIAGVISRTGEVRVHCDTCKLLKAVNPERRVKVRWVPSDRSRK